MKFHELIEVCSHFCEVRMEFTKFETVTYCWEHSKYVSQFLDNISISWCRRLIYELFLDIFGIVSTGAYKAVNRLQPLILLANSKVGDNWTL